MYPQKHLDLSRFGVRRQRLSAKCRLCLSHALAERLKFQTVVLLDLLYGCETWPALKTHPVFQVICLRFLAACSIVQNHRDMIENNAHSTLCSCCGVGPYQNRACRNMAHGSFQTSVIHTCLDGQLLQLLQLLNLSVCVCAAGHGRAV